MLFDRCCVIVLQQAREIRIADNTNEALPRIASLIKMENGAVVSFFYSVYLVLLRLQEGLWDICWRFNRFLACEGKVLSQLLTTQFVYY